MQRRLIALGVESILAGIWAFPAASQVSGLSTTIYCPQTVVTGVPTERLPDGWGNGGYSSANFSRREIRGGTFYCLYGSRAEFSIFSLVPKNAQCAIDPNYSDRFNCTQTFLKPPEPNRRPPTVP